MVLCYATLQHKHPAVGQVRETLLKMNPSSMMTPFKDKVVTYMQKLHLVFNILCTFCRLQAKTLLDPSM